MADKPEDSKPNGRPVEVKVQGTNYTVDLTKRFERGELSPAQYARQRANAVGKPNIVQGLLSPLYDFFFTR